MNTLSDSPDTDAVLGSCDDQLADPPLLFQFRVLKNLRSWVFAPGPVTAQPILCLGCFNAVPMGVPARLRARKRRR